MESTAIAPCDPASFDVAGAVLYKERVTNAAIFADEIFVLVVPDEPESTPIKKLPVEGFEIVENRDIFNGVDMVLNKYKGLYTKLFEFDEKAEAVRSDSSF